jgi:exodeoxyribonuclease VII large subunit
MQDAISLSELSYQVQEAIDGYFAGEIIWVKAEISDVKKYASKRWCFLTLLEKQGEQIVAKFRANIWTYGYNALLRFEEATKQSFDSGLEIICAVRISSHAVYGIAAEVVDIDISFAIGKVENDRQATINKLIAEHPNHIKLIDGQMVTYNNTISIPAIPQRIALIAAKGSDGYRDFLKEVTENNYGYSFNVAQFNVSVQGESAVSDMCKAIALINSDAKSFDVVALVRGGGSLLDFKPFNEYDLALAIATCEVPILAGIGHDANTSIADLVARQFKTPTKVAGFLVDQLFHFEASILGVQDRIAQRCERLINTELQFVSYAKRLLTSAHPNHWLQKGFAILKQGEKVIGNMEHIDQEKELIAQLYNGKIRTTINSIENEK